MYPANRLPIIVTLGVLFGATPCWGQLSTATGGPQGLRPVTNSLPSTSSPVMVPLNPTRSFGFDPYAASPGALGGYGSLSGALMNQQSSVMPPPNAYQPPVLPYPGNAYGSNINPALTTPGAITPGLPSTGVMGAGVYGSGSSVPFNNPYSTYPGGVPPVLPNSYSSPGVSPNSMPPVLFPGTYGAPSGYNSMNGWNPQGTLFGENGQVPGFIRLFQGPRIRHAYLHGDKAHDDLSINDTDVAIAIALPFCHCTTQPVYLLPSFSLHQWAGPRPNATNNADLPPIAYSGFIDTGWQSEPAKILGAELGLRVGVFSDFNTFTSRSLRVMGRAIGRVRMTPQCTLKLGVLYLDRNRVKLLPAGGLLWQPNPGARLDLFFPEPKLSAFLTTMGNHDTWWYLAGYYGGGSWTIKRADNTDDSIDINDIRATVGLEWGRNEMMRDGRRTGFAEVGYVFDRELLYKARPGDNLQLQDTFVIRVGLGY